MTVSLVDVAARAQVSVGTVSHVLNRNKKARIAKPTQERVWRIATEMGYRPNVFARSLHSKQTRTIGLIVAGLQNPFFVDVAREFERIASDYGYQVILDTKMDEVWAYREHGTTCTWPVDGAFIWSTYDQDLVKLLGAQGDHLPNVYLGYHGGTQRDTVAFDIADGGRQMARHVIERGYRRIACVGGLDDLRVIALSEVCASVGIKPEVISIEPTIGVRTAALELGIEIARRQAADRTDVVVCTDDIQAIGVYNGLRRMGLRVPEDIGVTGFDGIEDGRCLDNPLTTVRCPIEDLARKALEMLIGRINEDGEGEPPNRIMIPVWLSVGSTTR